MGELTSKTSWTSFPNVSERTIRLLANTERVLANDPLFAEAVCIGILGRIDASQKCTTAQAQAYTARFLSRYPGMAEKQDDGNGYAAYGVQIFQCFEAFTTLECEAAMAIPDGSLASLTYNPRVPEVVEALKAERTKFQKIRAGVLTQIQERERRRQIVEDCQKPAPDLGKRREQVEALIRTFRAS